MNLKVESARKYDGNFPTYNLPIELGYFSINSNGKFCNDKHQMKYLVMPTKLTGLHMDLDEGYSQYIHKFEDTEDDFLVMQRWIISHQDIVKKCFVDRFTSRTKIDFVCFRGTLTGICSTIYEKINDWKIIATKYKSTIYLTSVLTESRIEREETMPEREQHMCTWGFKFEQYMTSGAMDTKPDTSVPVNENEKYYTVAKGKLGNHILLFAAEVDGVDPAHFDASGHDPTSVLRYVELKTSRMIESKKQDWTFRRHKLLQWYLQSFLIGIPQVICGFRDDEGIVRKLGIFNVRDMPKIVNNLWSSAACLNFCSHFLDYLKRTVVKDYPTTAYSFYWEPGSEIICKERPGIEGFLCDYYTENLTIS